MQSIRRNKKRTSPAGQAETQNRRPVEKLLRVVLAIFAATIGWLAWQRAHSPARLLAQARQAMELKDYATVERLCRRIVPAAPESPSALLLAAAAAAGQDRLRDAADYYDQIRPAAGGQAVTARCEAGEIWQRLGYASKAEAKYREALAIEPRNAVALARLANLLAIVGRRFEALPHLYELLRQWNYSYDILWQAGEHTTAIEAPDQLALFRAAEPSDPAPLVGLARIELRNRDFAKAEALARQAIANDPNSIEAHALLGRVLLEGPDDDALAKWARALPAGWQRHPDIWAVRGGLARRQGEREIAARCFWEALRRDANHRWATLQLSQLLDTLGSSQAAKSLARRAAALTDFSVSLELVSRRLDDLPVVARVARQAEALGRLWEACGWYALALSMGGEGPARQAIDRLERQLDESVPTTLAAADPGKWLDLSQYPLPAEIPNEHSVARPTPAGANPRFTEVAHEAGIDFVNFSGREGTEPRVYMYESLGGGIGVLDYDLDGWPDLYFTQGCRWPPRAEQTEHLDVVYRNLGHERFHDMTKASGLGDERFSQGVTVGDFNNDGFADLYVANIGVNRLYMNNGDGTFSDISESAGIAADHWTSSCLLADVNGDGLPDLYDVNYVQGPDVFERTCGVGGSLPCSPTTFEPAPDCFYLNLGDGRFVDMTEAAGLNVARGNGLGILASDLAGNGRLSLFVANDQDGNLYFVNQTPVLGGPPQFVERALLSGLALNGEGGTQASMGVAAGDANGDGKLDLLVTNFSEESSTLYVQEDDQLFNDGTGPSGLREASYPMLGFGTQFLDGDLDGSPDLVVTNGHVHEFTAPGVSGAMRPQYFRNRGDGRFEERSADSLGAYFQQTYFGRSLVRLDFNRDGRDDFAVSALDAPAALLRNDTAHCGHFLAIQLRGVRSSRDATGAVVMIESGQRRQRQWLNAGDGFQASNERRLTFGLGPATSVDKLVITWPSGLVQEFVNLAADQELLFVEGSPRANPLPR